MDGSPSRLRPDSIYGIFQARILEQVAISSSRGSIWPRNRVCISCVSSIADGLFTTQLPRTPPSSSTKSYFEGPKLQGLVYLPPPYGQKGKLHGPLLGAYNLNLRWELATPSTLSSYLTASTHKKATSWQRKSSQISECLNKIPSVGTEIFTGGKKDSTLHRSFNLPEPVSSLQNGDKTDLTGLLWELNEILYLKP